MNNYKADFLLPYARFSLTMEASQDAVLPPYLGSTLRGAMGHALRRMVCLTPGGDCKTCMHRWQCAFVYIMATSRQETDSSGKVRNQPLPHPYIIEPSQERITHYHRGDLLKFQLILVGNSIQLAPLFIAAFDKAGQNGLGKDRHRFILRNVEQIQSGQTSKIWQGGNNLLSRPEADELRIKSTKDDISRVCIQMRTPVRLVDRGRLEDNPAFSVFMRAVFRRIDSLGRVHGNGGLGINFRNLLEKAAMVEPIDNQITWQDWERYSSTQSCRMKLGGMVGQISYEGPLNEFIPYLQLAEVLHVGKGSSFGLGRYSLKI